MKKISVFIFVFILFASCKMVYAFETLEIHLFYNASTDTLSFDKSFSPTINLNKNKDTNLRGFDETYSRPGPYEIMFIGVDDIFLGTYPFTPSIGAFTFETPHFPTMKTVEIRKSVSSTFLLTQDVSQYTSCNRNGVCEYEKGEDMEKCVIDCSNGFVEYSTQTIALFDANNGEILDPQTGLLLIKDARERQRGNGQTGPIPSQDDPSMYVNIATSTTPDEELTNEPEEGVQLPGDALEPTGTSEPPEKNTAQTSPVLITVIAIGFLVAIVTFLFFLYRRKNT